MDNVKRIDFILNTGYDLNEKRIRNYCHIYSKTPKKWNACMALTFEKRITKLEEQQTFWENQLVELKKKIKNTREEYEKDPEKKSSKLSKKALNKLNSEIKSINRELERINKELAWHTKKIKKFKKYGVDWMSDKQIKKMVGKEEIKWI